MASDDSYSEDEIFFGPRTLDEIRKQFIPKSCRQTVGCVKTSPGAADKINRSFRLIETQSLPNISLESMPPLIKRRSSSPLGLPYETKCYKDRINTGTSLINTEKIEKKHEDARLDNTQKLSYNQKVENFDSTEKKMNATPNKDEKIGQLEIFTTPCSELKFKTPLFKTPGKFVSHKLPVDTTARSTKKRFEHIISPVANYIYNCPSPTLMTNVHVKKGPGSSGIPRLVKNTPGFVKHDKENLNLPAIAYRPAKETKVVTNTEENKLPNSAWAKQVASSIPKAVVLQHSHRQMNSVKKAFKRQEDSFDNLSLNQADISFCTQKSAFIKNKKI